MKFSIGRALAEGFRDWRRGIPTSLLVFAACWAPVVAILRPLVDTARPDDAARAFCSFHSVLYFPTMFTLILGHRRVTDDDLRWLGTGVIAQLLLLLAMGLLAHRALHRTPLLASAWAALRRLPALLALFVLSTVMVGLFYVAFGFLMAGVGFAGLFAWLVVIPALFALWIVAARYWITLPIIVAENTSFSAALARSTSLTAGARTRLATLAILLHLFMWLVLILLGQFGYFDTSVKVWVWMNLAVAVLVGSLRAVVMARSLEQLRFAAEGPATETLEEIFE